MENVTENRKTQYQGYGAAELKPAIGMNTFKAFIYTIAGFVFILALCIPSRNAESKGPVQDKFKGIIIDELIVDTNRFNKVYVAVEDEMFTEGRCINVELFDSMDTYPGVDIELLQKSIEYPEMARRAGIEGRVIVRVWIDKAGNPHSPAVVKSDSRLLNNAALKAIMNIKFTPATRNNQPAGSWIIIPVKFELTD